MTIHPSTYRPTRPLPLDLAAVAAWVADVEGDES